MTMHNLVAQATTLDQHLAARGEPWSKPLPFVRHDLPAFPVDVLPDWLYDYVLAETEAKQTPVDLAAMLALSVLSTACARHVVVEAAPGWCEPINLYTVTALPPASRKSPIFAAMTSPIVSYERELLQQAESDIVRVQAQKDILEQRIQAAKRETAQAKGQTAQQNAMDKLDELLQELQEITVPPRPRLVVDDITSEKLSSMLADHGRIAALSPEGNIFNIIAGRYSGDAPNFDVYLKSYNGEMLRVDRKSRDAEIVYAPAITMGLTVQPEVIRGLGDKRAMRGLGLLGRLIYAMPVSTVGRRRINPDPVPSEVRMAYHSRVRWLLAHVPELAESYSGNSGNSGNQSGDSDNTGNRSNNLSLYIYILKMTEEARERLVEWQEYLEPQLAEEGTLGALADWAGKLAGTTVRIAGLLHMAGEVTRPRHNSHNSQNKITKETVDRAIAVAQYLIPHARAAFAEMGADPAQHAARRVLVWLEQAQPLIFTKRECYQATKGTFRQASDLDPVLELLMYHGHIRLIEDAERPGPGRKPSQRYEVNPAVYAPRASLNGHSSVVPFVSTYERPQAADVESEYRGVVGF